LGQFTLINREAVYKKRKLSQTRLYRITCSNIRNNPYIDLTTSQNRGLQGQDHPRNQGMFVVEQFLFL